MVARFLPAGRDVAFKPDGTVVIANPTNSSIPAGVAFRKTEEVPPRPTDPIKDGESKQQAKSNTTASTAVKKLPAVVKNPMEPFANTNVLWTMACLTPKQFNDPRSYRNSPADLQNIVFSSGGRFDKQRVGTFFGTPEYYINNFVMTNIIGANEKTGNSNAVKFTFDIIEPHSMGLLLQSMQNAAVKAGYLSYLDNAPFVLRMDIQGWDTRGLEIKVIKPKYFVMKLTSTKFTVNEGGSVYKVEGIPYNHLAFSDSINTTFSDVKLFAEPIGNVFSILAGTGEGSLVTFLNKNEKQLKKENKIKVCDEYAIQFPVLSTDFVSSAGKAPKLDKATVDPNQQDEIATARNRLKAIVANTTGTTTTDSLNDKNDIAAASLGFDQLRGGNPLFKRANDQYDEKTGVIKRDGMTISPTQRAFQFGQGQSLTAIINQIILSSDYASRAIDPKFLTPQGYIKWFKLDPQIELLEFDDKIGDYAKKITWRIVPYYVHQSIFANSSSAPVGYAELMKSVVKEYQYIYTGQNVDVLNFNIEINNLFYTGANPKPENEAGKTANQDQKGSEVRNSRTQAGAGQAPEVKGAQAGRARAAPRDPKLLKGYKGGSDDKTVEQNVAENFQQAFISGNSADMVTVSLEILGDPYWLVDTGFSNYFVGAPSPTSQITDDGTMNYESGNVYVYLTFRTPADVNPVTGLYDFSIAGKESPFGGIYRVNMCENTFNDGQWKQKLKLLRMPGPQGPEKAVTESEDKNASKISKEGSSATEIGEKEPPKTSIADSGTTANAPVPANQSNTRNSNARTTTTSNQGQRVVGFRYYRDLGQN
jgi:hypothetical protein